MAVLNVGHAKRLVRSATVSSLELHAVHLPEEGDPSHAELQGMEAADMLVGELLAEAAREGGVHSVAMLLR